MNNSGITRGVTATVVATLAVAGLPLFTSPAHAVVTSLEIVNRRDRPTFDLDEIRDGDDFWIHTLNAAGERAGGAAPQFRWVLDTAAGTVTGEWVSAERRNRGRYRVLGPSRTNGLDGIKDQEVAAGTWTLQARADGIPDADPVEVAADESEITLDGPISETAGGTHTVTGTLATGDGGLAGREVSLTYARQGGGDAHFQGGGLTTTVVTGADGTFSVTLQDSGSAGESGRLAAVASGEEAGDATQLPHRYGPDDADHADADAADAATATWEGPLRAPIAAALKGKNNGARADVLKVVAPTKAHGAQVRLFRVRPGGRLALLQTRQLNRVGDKKIRVKDRNRSRPVTYLAKVGATARTLADQTNRRRVR